MSNPSPKPYNKDNHKSDCGCCICRRSRMNVRSATYTLDEEVLSKIERVAVKKSMTKSGVISKAVQELLEDD